MSVLYVKEQGSCIQKRSERIVVTKGQMTLLEIPLANVENIAIIGNVQITTQALHMLYCRESMWIFLLFRENTSGRRLLMFQRIFFCVFRNMNYTISWKRGF